MSQSTPRKQMSWIILVLVICFAISSGATFAQTSKGTIAGSVSDPTGALVPGVSVKALNKDLGGEVRNTTTDSSGSYRIDGLNPGIYTLTFTASGFATLTIEQVDVKASLITAGNAKMELGTVSTSVNVEASSGAELQTQSGDISHNIGRKEVAEIPILGLNPISLVLTEPGVVAPSGREDFTNGVGFSVNGTRPRANNFLIDGQDNNDNSISGQAFQPTNLEAIGEVSILTNSYGAEFGRGGGSVTNVIYKGGTNQFHGSAWDLIQNSALQSIDAGDKLAGVTRIPVFVENTFGFSFGGPIIKDKLFVFGTSQWDRSRSTANGSRLRLPTDNGIAALQSLGTNTNVSTLIAALGGLRGTASGLQSFALGNGRPSIETGFVERSGVAEISNDRQWDVRMDWLPRQSDTFTFRYLQDDSVFTPDFFNFPNSLPPFDSQQGGRSLNMGITYTHTFSARAINEFRFSFGRINFLFGATPATAANPIAQLQSVSITGFTSWGLSSALPQGRLHNTWQFQDGYTYTIGKHTIKAGLDLTRLQVRDAVPFNFRGTLTINSSKAFTDPVTGLPVPAFTAVGNFVDNFTGAAGAASKVFGDQVVYPYMTMQSYYIQDTWRIKPNFTLNWGLRYENWGTPENVLKFPAVSGGFGDFNPFPNRVLEKSDNNNFAPRIGIAYTPHVWPGLFGHDKTVIRAGYGMFYDGIFTNILDNTAGTSPNAAGGTITGGAGRGLTNAFGLVGTLTATLSRTATVNSVTENLLNPLTHQWNFDIQRELPWNLVVTAAYVGTRGEKLFVNDTWNPGIGDFVHRLNPTRGAITMRDNTGDSIYHGFNFKADRRFSKGLLIRAAYTWSKLIDNGSEVFTTSGGSSQPQDAFNRRNERGLSAFDRRQRLVFTYVYELPSLRRNDNFAMSALSAVFRDWQISGTTAFQTGAPITVIPGFDINGDLNGGSDRPNMGNPSAPITAWAYDGSQVGGTPGVLYDGPTANSSGDLVPVSANSVHWIVQGAGIGNVGRNTVISPGRQDWNFSILRRIKMPIKRLEGQQLEFRTEFFNVFNHPNQGNLPFNLQDPDFGNPEVTRFGQRQIRFWLKYSF
jgi:hypothetical protein